MPLKHRRALVLVELDGDPHAPITAARRFAPEAELLLVRLPSRKLAWLSGEAAHASEASRDDAIEETVLADPSAESLVTLADQWRIDLLVAGSLPLSSIPMIGELRKRRSIAVLWIPATATASSSERPPTEIVCVAIGERSCAAFVAFLRDHAEPEQHVTVLTLGGRSPRDRAAALDVAGVRAAVDFVASDRGSPVRWIEQHLEAHAVDLVVFARFPGALLLRAKWPVPILLLPPTASVSLMQRGIDGPDLADDGGPLRACFEYAVGLGLRAPIADQELSWVSGGRTVAVVMTEGGRAELPPECHADSYGVYRVGVQPAADPAAAIELRVAVVRPAAGPLMLFDSELSDEELSLVRGLSCDRLAVRIRPTRNCRSIRERLAKAGLDPRVIDARLILDEGSALDVAEVLNAVRLSRVATRMRNAGFPVTATMRRGGRPVALDQRALTLRPHDKSLGSRLEATTGAALLAGNRIELELDNTKARGWLLRAITDSTRRVHLQVYMAADDELGRSVEAALVEAGARGVAVRVLVDSLHGLHGSLGTRNPLLERLEASPGVELLVSRPIVGVPSLSDLKQRDHRKLVVVDGDLALLGGRNLSHEYYTGFDDVVLTTDSMWRQVPWLDAGARVQGPAVAALERSFLQAWIEAGGGIFDVAEQGPVGATSARVVIHRGLEDAHTLEAYLALIETARSHVIVVNGFPLILEIQHALLRALRRGVRVRTLFGHLTPTHGGELFSGPMASARAAATSLSHSRMDALVAAGAEAHQFEIPEQPRWAPGLGAVRTHVHAKVMAVDGRACAIGSANLDITAGYWESELLLVVEDVPVTALLEARIAELIGGSRRVDRDDPEWQALARRREWMRHWPGVLSV